MFLFRKIFILTVLMISSQTLSAQSQYDNIKIMNANRVAMKQALTDSLATFQKNSAAANQHSEKKYENLERAFNESETKNAEIKHSIAILEFVQRIVDLEIKAGRPQPIRAIPSDTPTVGRFLVNCSNTELINPWIFLDVAEKFMNRTWKASKAAINSEAQFKCTKEKTGV